MTNKSAKNKLFTIFYTIVPILYNIVPIFVTIVPIFCNIILMMTGNIDNIDNIDISANLDIARISTISIGTRCKMIISYI